MKTAIVLRSVVSPELIRQVLLQGSLLALAGGFILLFGGMFIPVDVMQKWGWFVFLCGLGLIAMGMIPYRRLVRDVSTIRITEDAVWIEKGRVTRRIGLERIQSVRYEKGGIVFELKDGNHVFVGHYSVGSFHLLLEHI